MSTYNSKNEIVQDRQLKVQRLVIPFTLTHNATPASVILRNDEPSVMFLQSEGVNQITAALASGETATYSTSPVDANGTMNILIKVGEVVTKIERADMVSRTTGVAQPTFLGSATGISSAGNIMLTLDSSVNHATTDADACITVEYIVAQ